MNKIRTIAMLILTAGLALTACEEEKNYVDRPGALVPKTVDEDASIPSIFVNNTQLHAEAVGNPAGSMLVVLHGGPGSDYRYLLNSAEFASQGYYVVFYDQRGSGLSRRHAKESYSIDVMTDDLSAVIGHYRTSPQQKVFLLGQSWGGMLATAFINKYPAAITGTILVEPGGFVWQDVRDYVKRLRAAEMTSEGFNDSFYFSQIITGNEDQQEILDYKAALAFAGQESVNIIGNDGKVPFWRMGAVINKALFELGNKENPDWTTNLHQYETEVLFVYSERNKAYGPEHAQKVSSAYPNAKLFLVRGAGHNLISFPTGWANFYPAALEYLNTLNN